MDDERIFGTMIRFSMGIQFSMSCQKDLKMQWIIPAPNIGVHVLRPCLCRLIHVVAHHLQTPSHEINSVGPRYGQCGVAREPVHNARDKA